MFLVAMKLKIYRNIRFCSADGAVCPAEFREQHPQNIDKKNVYFYNEEVNL